MTSLTDVNFSFESADAYSAMLFVCLSVFLLTARCILGAGQWLLRVLTVFTCPSWIKQDALVCALKSLA